MTEAEPENQEANELEVFFTNLKGKLGGEESKDILSGVSIVAAALEKNIPTFHGEITKEDLTGQVLASMEKLLSLEDLSSCVKALKCYGELLRQDAVDCEGDEKALEMRRTIKSFLKVTSVVLEKASGSSPGKGSPKKNEKDLGATYSALLGALVKVYNAYTFKSSKLVVLDGELAKELQSALVGAKDKQSLLAKTNVLGFLASAPMCFPSEAAFQGVVESTLDIALGPFKAYVDSAKEKEAEGGDNGDAASAPFETTDEITSVFSAAAALVRNNQSLVSETNLLDWTSSTLELLVHLFKQHKSDSQTKDPQAAKTPMPELVGVDFILEIFNSALAKKTPRSSVLAKCMECKLPALLGEKIRLLVYGPKKEEGPSEPASPEGSPTKKDAAKEAAADEEEVDSVSEVEASDILMLTTALFRLAGDDGESPIDLYKAINNVVEGIPEAEEEKPAEQQEEDDKTEGGEAKEETTQAEGEEQAKETAKKEEDAQDAAATAEESTEAEAEAPEVQDPAEAENEEEEEASGLQDGLLLATLAVASGNLNFEAVKVSSESDEVEEEEVVEEGSPTKGSPTKSVRGSPTKKGESPTKSPTKGQGENTNADEKGKEEEESQQQPEDDLPEEKPVQFLVQDSAAQLLYTIAISSTRAHFSDICVPSTILKMLDTSKILPKPVLQKLLVVLLYTSGDKEKTRIALEQSSQHLGADLEVLGGGFMNVANGLCVLSSFKIDLEALLPIKCPPEPSPPPTPPPPPLATNKFLWDALGRPEMIDGGNLPTLKRLNVKAN